MQNGNDKLAKHWKDIAAEIYGKHREWNSGQIHRELIDRLGEGRAPGLNAVQKWRQVQKPEMEKIIASGVDTPWHVGLLRNTKQNSDYGFTPEALEYIHLVKEYDRKYNQEVLTIRKAIWVNILYSAYKIEIDTAMQKKKQKDLHRWAGQLSTIAWLYAEHEIRSNVLGIPLDTTELDYAWDLDYLAEYISDLYIKGYRPEIREALNKGTISWNNFISDKTNGKKDGE